MRKTRAEYASWLVEQPEALASVEMGPWYATGPMETAGERARSLPDSDLVLSPPGQEEKPLWQKHDEWKDGEVVGLGSPLSSPTTVFLSCAIAATKPKILTVGIGGGDRLDVRLNGRLLVSKCTTLPYKRYGTGALRDGNRIDQLLVDLRLVTGQNNLLIAVHQEAPGVNGALEFCFSPKPHPVPRLWERFRAEFPPSENHLLECVDYRWFEEDGWLAAGEGTDFEQGLLERALSEMGEAAAALRQRRDGLVADLVRGGDPRWLDLCVTAAELSQAWKKAGSLRVAVQELHSVYPQEYAGLEFLRRIADLEDRLIAKAAERLDPGEAASRDLLTELKRFQRAMLVDANPLLRNADLLFVRRYTYDSRHYYDDYYNGLRRWGGNLCRLSLDDGKVREIAPELNGGIFDRYDLSFDGKRIAFGYRKPEPEGFRIYETGTDGTGLRQLTFRPSDEDERVERYRMYSRLALTENPLLYGHWTDDMHPCYLPDGGIVFSSSRCERSVLCGGHDLTASALYRMDGDGGAMRPLSQGALSEFCSTVMNDGRLLYNRWEYVDKGIAAIQALWSMYPNGERPEEVYGNNIADPGVFLHGRNVPGHNNLVVCTGVGHEPLAVGTIILLDLHKDKRTRDAMTYLTPDTDVKHLRGLYQKRNGKWNRDDVYGPFYSDPYPLSDKSFLVSCNPDKRYNDESAYGIYLLDVFGNRVPIYDDPEMSCWQPMLLRPRTGSQVVASVSATDAEDAPGEATMLIAQAHRGLDGVEAGEVRHIRIWEQIPRPWSAWQERPEDASPGQMVAISLHTHISVWVLLGIVPVEEDGSAYFRVPSRRNIFFQALDKDFMEIQRMRTFINLEPGETRSCVGCHDSRQQSPPDGRPLALRHAPATIGPQPGEVAPRPLDYERDVQPVFDRHCVGCHGGEKPKGGLDLSSEMTALFNRSYENLITKELVSFIQEWSTLPAYGNWDAYANTHGPMSNAEPKAPRSIGSHASKLVHLLRKGHHDVKLSQPEFVKIVTWIDANAPYYGSYFGRRNIAHKEHPDFRQPPTLESARGTPPKAPEPAPVAASLVARWPLAERSGEKAGDLSGSRYDGLVQGAEWEEDSDGARLRFDGTGYVEMGDLGQFETLSLAMWVKADALLNTWSPLLFCNGWEQADLHFSLLTDGAVNVAWNGRSVVHRHSRATVNDGQWHHIAAVLDFRYGGRVRFYIDGKPDHVAEFGDGLSAVLNGFRVGGWNRWEEDADKNFHGALRNVCVYRGLLSQTEIATLAQR